MDHDVEARGHGAVGHLQVRRPGQPLRHLDQLEQSVGRARPRGRSRRPHRPGRHLDACCAGPGWHRQQTLSLHRWCTRGHRRRPGRRRRGRPVDRPAELVGRRRGLPGPDRRAAALQPRAQCARRERSAASTDRLRLLHPHAGQRRRARPADSSRDLRGHRATCRIEPRNVHDAAPVCGAGAGQPRSVCRPVRPSSPGARPGRSITTPPTPSSPSRSRASSTTRRSTFTSPAFCPCRTHPAAPPALRTFRSTFSSATFPATT